MFKLTFEVTTSPDLSGWKFFVAHGKLFYSSDYCEAYGINESDLLQEGRGSIKEVQEAVSHLNEGEWLEVTHEEVEE